MRDRQSFYDILSVLAVSSVMLFALAYAYVVYVYDFTTLLVCIIFPLIFGSVIFAVRKRWVPLFAFLAYFWTIVDDKPIFFDSVLTWPEVTRFHPFLPRLYMNIVLHALTLIFLYFTIREPLKKVRLTHLDMLKVAVPTFVAFVLAYAQNIPLTEVQNIVYTSWYPFDAVEKLCSMAVLYSAVQEAMKLRMKISPNPVETI